MNGYTGKVLRVDLSKGSFAEEPLGTDLCRSLLGGAGMAAAYFLDEVDPMVDPLSPANTLYIFCGPLTGTMVPGSSRFAAGARSPLTGLWGEGSCGGGFGHELKQAGWDGIVIEGASRDPVYLLISDDRVEIRSADDLWGRDNYELDDLLVERHRDDRRRPQVLLIGPAGEKLVAFANIANDKGDFVGRTGMGAVMGSKRLKGIVVLGSGKVPVADEQGCKLLRKRLAHKTREAVPAMSLNSMGTDSGMDLGMMTGDVPIKNWSVGEDFDLSMELGGPAMTERYLKKASACRTCTIACKRVVEVDEPPWVVERGPGAEYETCATFGTMLQVKNLAAVLKANEWANRYGVDTISCGCVIALAMDCYEKGILSPEQASGIDLSWGNPEAAIDCLHLVARREGLGELLALGSRAMAEKLGPEAQKLSAEVKGLDLPMHDPRAYHGMGLAYMTSNRGACHLAHLVHPIEQGMTVYDVKGLEEDYPGPSSEGKALMVKISENMGIPSNSLCICQFDVWCFAMDDLLEAIRVVTGWDMGLDEYLAVGERTWYLKRGIINLMGARREDDRLPAKVLTPVEEGAAAGSVPDVDMMLEEYYQLRELGPDGIPTREVLERVGLSGLAARLHGC